MSNQVVITVDGGGGESHEVECYCSVHLQSDGQEKFLHFDLPHCRTSNESEYFAVIKGLEEVQREFPGASVLVRSDSKLVVMQCRGKWKVKARNLLPLRDRVLRMASTFSGVHFQWVPRKDVEALLGH